MKRTMIFAFVLCFGMALSAQNIPEVINKQQGKEYKVYEAKATKLPNPFMNEGVSMLSSKGMLAPNETEIGETFYDLQTNASLDNRFIMYEDGTMAAVWTRGIEATSFPNRGTGYNYFDGTIWGPWPTDRLEDTRCGWPSLTAWGTGGEMNVAHNGSEGLEFMQRDIKGTGTWTQTNFLGPAGIENDITWPRIITSGPNNEYIHMFVHSYVEYAGQPGAILYSRSNDGGATWDPHNVILDDLGEDNYFEIQPDNYTLTARGNTVCLLIGSSWMDLLYMRSDDNGDTWEKNIVWEHPYKLLDPETMYTDTFFCMDRTAQMCLDVDGKAHVVFALQRALSDETGFGLYAWNADYDGIAYWNEDMDPFSDHINALAPPQLGYEGSEMVEDVNYVGWMQDIDGDGVVTLEGIMNYHSPGMSTMPTIRVDDDGRMFLIFSSNAEGFVYTGGTDPVNYKHLFFRQYGGEFNGWGPFTDLTGDISHFFDECIYPLIGGVDAQYVHYIYNADISPGNAFNGDHEWHQNRTIYGYTDIMVGVDEIGKESLQVSLNPNPASERAIVSLSLEDPTDVYVSLSAITGQIVKEAKRSNLSGNVKIGLDVSDLPAGTYICTVKAGNLVATEKLIVR